VVRAAGAHVGRGPRLDENDRSFYSRSDMGKGEDTRRSIVEQALRIASEQGLQGLSIGVLAERVGMSKSGLFAHFSSKDNLQVAVLDEAVRRFVELVISPALREPRGEPRVRGLLSRWLSWAEQDFMPGGCIFFAAAVELDDRPGPARERLVASQLDWLGTLAQAVRIAQEEGHFRSDLEPEQFAFEAYGVFDSYQVHKRLLRVPHVERRVQAAFERLLADARAPQRAG
jgi:AcrR family transcriptional regulator